MPEDDTGSLTLSGFPQLLCLLAGYAESGMRHRLQPGGAYLLAALLAFPVSLVLDTPQSLVDVMKKPAAFGG